MRLLLLSDIHANLEALEACLNAAPSCDFVVNLGDVVGYGACPNEVIDRVRRLGPSLHIRGNHDRACSGQTGADGFNPVAAYAARWTQHALTPENLAWLRSLPAGPVAVPGAEDVLCVHGSPRDEDEYLFETSDALGALTETEALRGIPIPVTFFGHTHTQGGFMLNRRRNREIDLRFVRRNCIDSVELRLNRIARYVINPGSVGQPRDDDWRAGFAVFDTLERILFYCRVPYDVKTASQRILDAGLPERLALRLTAGH